MPAEVINNFLLLISIELLNPFNLLVFYKKNNYPSLIFYNPNFYATA